MISSPVYLFCLDIKPNKYLKLSKIKKVSKIIKFQITKNNP